MMERSRKIDLIGIVDQMYEQFWYNYYEDEILSMFAACVLTNIIMRSQVNVIASP